MDPRSTTPDMVKLTRIAKAKKSFGTPCSRITAWLTASTTSLLRAMDIRSFFGKASAGGGGGGSAAKDKTPPPGKNGAGKSGGKTAAAAAADKPAPTNKRQGNASPSRNKGISKMR